VPTFQEVIDLAKQARVGIYPETKHPTYFDSIGLSLEELLMATLRANGLDGPRAKVFIQSFETANLKELTAGPGCPWSSSSTPPARRTTSWPAGDPRTYADLVTPAGLAEIATYADGIGPSKDLIVPRDSAGNLLSRPAWSATPTGRAGRSPVDVPQGERLPAAGLPPGQPGQPRVPPRPRRPPGRAAAVLPPGVDGVFSDNADSGGGHPPPVFGRADP
jgi:glycerophosphoryl diester phosphodiesterase